MSVGLIALDYRQAGVDRREAIARRIVREPEALARLREAAGLSECVLISTCNRVEIYWAGGAGVQPEAVSAWLEPEGVASAWAYLHGREAIEHLMRVAAGLESMVLGEPQILGQVRCSYHDAQEAGSVGPALHAVFQRALAVGKAVRQQTGISEGRTSVASIAIEHVRAVFDGFAGKTILSVGAGHMCKAMLRSLEGDRPKRVLIANRSVERARGLASSLGGDADVCVWDDVGSALSAADVVLCGTGSTDPVVTVDLCRAAMADRRQEPQVIVDVAVPRDVEPEVGGLANVFLVNVDQLQTMASATLDRRADAVCDCEGLIGTEVDQLVQSMSRQEAGHVIRRLRRRVQAIAEQEMERTRQRVSTSLDGQSDEAASIVEEHTRRLLNKILHLPVSRLGVSDRVSLLDQIEVLEDAFGLDVSEDKDGEAG
ncbi:glutamyl-tRNA reductase [Mucisphaera calidilacus]|uniref:Glutamyl-tRNA reductase n=1 Tax=Mucisphaera calidilacus TaxID=2527982 RepID=A0A518BZ79_9BACT|nr:glutamyl-tRNA reductase [Mucisphaera calidilacus]QDU72278.1 Glutamyl-tRNA reductase [Mucisphaera calidilacus]